ncbi:hypothetical protein BOX15_Mlig009660g1 [Macrostomum lignano]|uniref:C2 domain-containing protein n=1 Tax=Macrostomum lignano TaxID=282301 RepID=A0A267EXE8_9PLAT|nr:hypothetical protein BOX15_Mlig009660g1 [Macrostomum lignano]
MPSSLLHSSVSIMDSDACLRRNARCYSVSSELEDFALHKLVNMLAHLPGRKPAHLGLQSAQLLKHLFTVMPLPDVQQLELMNLARNEPSPEVALAVRLSNLVLTTSQCHLGFLHASLCLSKPSKSKSSLVNSLWPSRSKTGKSPSFSIATATSSSSSTAESYSCSGEFSEGQRSVRVKPRIDHLSNAVWQFDQVFVFRGLDCKASSLDIVFHSDHQPSMRRAGSLNSSSSSSDSASHFVCCTSIPLRDITCKGLKDTSFDALLGNRPSNGRAKTIGTCTVDVSFIFANSITQEIAPVEADCCTVPVTYAQLYELLYTRVLLFENRKMSIGSDPNAAQRSYTHFLDNFSASSKNLLAVFESVAYFSALEVKLFRLVRCLHAILEKRLVDNDAFVRDLVAALKLETMHYPPGINQVQSVISSLRHFDVATLFTVVELYINYKLQDISSLPTIVPATEANFLIWRCKLTGIIDLLNLEHFFITTVDMDQKFSAKAQLVAKLTQRIQSDAKSSFQRAIGELKCEEHKELVLQDIDKMISVLDELYQSIENGVYVDDYFREHIGVQFRKIVVFSIDSLIMSHTRQLMALLNDYQSRYRNFMANITDSSKRSLKLYLTIKRFTTICRTFISEREIFKVSLCNLTECFSEASIFWLQTFKVQSQFRISRALEIEKDIVEIDSTVKISNSVVDVLSVFHKIISEWNEIDLVSCLDNVFGTLKMTDCICDGICFYAKKVCNILEANSLFDKRGQQFDVSDQLCISLNNIEHARKFLHNLPKEFLWEDALNKVVVPGGDEVDLRPQFVQAMESVIEDANDDVLLKCRKIERQVAERLHRDVLKHTLFFTRTEPDKRGSIDSLLGYLNTNLSMLSDKLEETICPRMLSAVWSGVLSAFSDTLLSGEKPGYYEMMLKHMTSIKSFFLHRGLSEDVLAGDSRYFFINEILVQNAKPTERLLLEYYSKLIHSSMGTPSNYLGHLTIKAGLCREAKGMLSLQCLIVDCKSLPGLDRNLLSDPYVIAYLKPETMFTARSHYRTPVMQQTTNPLFLYSFKASSIPQEFISEKGCCLHFLVMDHEYLRQDRCIGEVFFSLSDFDEIMPGLSWDAYPAFMKSIRRPSVFVHPISEEIVSQRSHWDRAADTFTNSRLYLQSRCSSVRSQQSRRTSSVFSFRRTFDQQGGGAEDACDSQQQQEQQQQKADRWQTTLSSLANELFDIAETAVCCNQASPVGGATSSGSKSRAAEFANG